MKPGHRLRLGGRRRRQAVPRPAYPAPANNVDVGHRSNPSNPCKIHDSATLRANPGCYAARSARDRAYHRGSAATNHPPTPAATHRCRRDPRPPIRTIALAGRRTPSVQCGRISAPHVAARPRRRHPFARYRGRCLGEARRRCDGGRCLRCPSPSPAVRRGRGRVRVRRLVPVVHPQPDAEGALAAADHAEVAAVFLAVVGRGAQGQRR